MRLCGSSRCGGYGRVSRSTASSRPSDDGVTARSRASMRSSTACGPTTPATSAIDVTVAITLSAANLPYLAASVRYFLERGLPSFTVSPIDTCDPQWDEGCFAELDRQLGKAFSACRAHFAATGAMPFAACSARATRPHAEPRGGVSDVPHRRRRAPRSSMSTARRWRAARSRRSLVALADRAAAPRRRGCPSRPRRRSRPGGAPRALPAGRSPSSSCSAARERKHSPYGACAQCSAARRVPRLPAGDRRPARQRGPRRRVPPLPCAFNLLTAKHRRRFQAWRRTAAAPRPI